MINTIISGGQVVTPWGVGDWDVAIEGEKIVAVAAPGYEIRPRSAIAVKGTSF